jgi:hypothetical protein
MAVAVGVGGPHVPRLNANHREACFGENAVKPLRQRSRAVPRSSPALLCPILLGFALHCRCVGVLHLEPVEKRPER